LEIKVNFLDKLRLEAKFDDFTVIADQPIRYKGDGSAPGPFDYFLASSALCAAYFVKLYCDTRNISTEHIRLSQNNIVDPENRYAQIFKIQVQLPPDISEVDRRGILNSIERCTVKKVVQEGPEFVIEEVANLDEDAQALLSLKPDAESSTFILGKDLPLEQTIANMSGILAGLGIKIEIASWRNIIPNVWSLHIRDAHSPMCFTNGKGATKESALASALGEYIERLNNNHFYAGAYWGEDLANAEFVHYPNEKWFKPGKKDALPKEILDAYCLKIYNPDGELKGSHLIDTNSGNVARGICALPFVRQSDQQVVYFPTNLVENLFVSNGMSAGNTLAEAQVQCLSEIFERAVKKEILEGEICLPDVPANVLAKYPSIAAGIQQQTRKARQTQQQHAQRGRLEWPHVTADHAQGRHLGQLQDRRQPKREQQCQPCPQPLHHRLPTGRGQVGIDQAGQQLHEHLVQAKTHGQTKYAGQHTCCEKFAHVHPQNLPLALTEHTQHGAIIQMPSRKCARRQSHGHRTQERCQQSHQMQKFLGAVQGLTHLGPTRLERLKTGTAHLGSFDIGLCPCGERGHLAAMARHRQSPIDATGRLHQTCGREIGLVHHDARRKIHEARAPVWL
jgi:uncharacterized OsmC-like protein